MSNSHSRLPGFAHFESSLGGSSLCGLEQLDIRFAGSEDVGLPPPYPGVPHTGLDLSNVNGLDLTSSQYEAGLNLTRTNNSREDQAGKEAELSQVLNLSTQIGLNLTRAAAVADAGDLNNYGMYNNNFEYYNPGYYDTSGTAGLCQMEEQRCSPLNLEHRSSPLNLTAVSANLQRKRKPTPGGVTAVQQDFTINNQVYDYRINNKLTAFYSQQEANKCQSKAVILAQNTNTKPYNNIPGGKGVTGSNTGQADQNVGDIFFSAVTSDLSIPDQLPSYSSCPPPPPPASKKPPPPLVSSGKNGSQLAEGSHSLLAFDSGQSADFLFQEDYEDLNYSYSDALNFAAEAMADNSGPSRGKVILEMKQSVVNDLSTNKNPAALLSSPEVSVQPVHTAEKHEKVGLFSCTECKINFYEESQLLTHNKLCHDTVRSKERPNLKKIFEAEDKQPMNMTLGSLKAREAHRKSRCSENKYQKNKSQAQIEKLKEESAKEPYPFQCITCAKKFSSKTDLVIHLGEHNEVKPFKCDICNLGFSHLSAKRRHEKGHYSGKTEQCPDCPKAFTRKSDLTQHLKSHSRNSLKFACPDCAAVFRTEKRLSGHTCSGGGRPPARQLQCGLCEGVLESKVAWGVHMWKHTKDSSYILTSESDPWPLSLLDKLPRDLADVNLWTSELQPLNMQAVPS